MTMRMHALSQFLDFKWKGMERNVPLSLKTSPLILVLSQDFVFPLNNCSSSVLPAVSLPSAGMSVPPGDSTSNECEYHLVLSASPPPLLSGGTEVHPTLLPLSPHPAPAPASRDGVKPLFLEVILFAHLGNPCSQLVKANIGHVMFSLASVSQTGKLYN